jgi:hypothetical protein
VVTILEAERDERIIEPLSAPNAIATPSSDFLETIAALAAQVRKVLEK